MPPVDSSPKPTTTTMSLIGVRAGDHTTIVIAMLRSLGYVELRIDEMKPRLLDFGSSVEETRRLLESHRDLVARLRSKQDQVEQLLAGADKLVTEQKTEDGVIVYEAMADSLGVAWRELNRQLDLRGYILEDALSFYQEAENHRQTVAQINNLLRSISNQQIIPEIQGTFSRILDITAKAVDLGSRIIGQIRVLGSLADNNERPAETANACLQIEKIMLRLAQEWESVDSNWSDQKQKYGIGMDQPAKPLGGKLGDQFNAVENWLRHAQAQVAHGADSAAIMNLMHEARQQKENLRRLQAQAESQKADPLVVRARELTNAIDAFMTQLEDKSQLGNRIQIFIQSADAMMNQLDKMETDLSNASAAIAGELGPLARQKALTVIEEGQNILRNGHNDQVYNKLNQLHTRLQQIEGLAQHRIQVGTQLLKTQIAGLTGWLRDVGEPFLTSNGNLGSDLNSANEFSTRHKQFATDVVNKEHEVNTVLNRVHELNNDDRRLLSDFEQRYENLKQTLESRIQLGNNFQQVQKFGRELDGSFQTLSALLDGNRDFSNDAVSQQMNNVFHVIQETLQQERHQAEKFISNTRNLTSHDLHLNSDQAIDSVRSLVSQHEAKFNEITQKWQSWQQQKTASKTASSTIEEVQMWQVDTYEIIRNIETAADKAETVEEREHVRERVEHVINQIPQQQQKLQEARRVVNERENEDTITRVQQAADTNVDIQNRLHDVHNKLTKRETTETFIQQDAVHAQQAPRLVTGLRDAQVDEGNRFEFAARVEAEPEPTITWSKDGMDVKNNVDYRQNYLNGVATLTIEETFIEDTAVYTLRIENPLGKAESSAKLIVKSKSQLGQEAEKPRFVKQLNNLSVTETETIRLECVVMGQPEPEVIWFKDEQTIKESERVRLEFHGDRCVLTAFNAAPSDAGIYKIAAKNAHGEATNFCRVNVQAGSPKKGPPVPPKPPTPVHEPPAFVPSLVNQTLEEGSKTVFQVRVTGQPFPKVTWKFKDQLIRQDGNVRIEEEAQTGWSRLIIDRIGQEHTGLYLCEAVNESGEARTGATLIVTSPGQAHNAQQRSVTMIQSEGFWSDGAYTGTPTPPPVPQHKYIVDENFQMQGIRDAGELGFSSIANAPDFVRPFQKEYTVDEGEKAHIDCLLVGNPRPKIHWLFNDRPIKSNYQFAEFPNIGDTYSIVLTPAKLENAGFYKLTAENIKGKAECLTVIHVRPRSLIPQPTKHSRRTHSMEHQKVVETFGALDYTELERRRQGHGTTPPPRRQHAVPITQMSQSFSAGQAQGQGQGLGSYQHVQQNQQQLQQQQSQFDHHQQLHQQQQQQKGSGVPPHFSQTLVSVVTTVGESARFEGVVSGTPGPEITWSKDGTPISKQTHPHVDFSNIGGRVTLVFSRSDLEDSGKYMCSAKNTSGVATSSAQLVVRPKTVAPDFVKRLISEEVLEGDRLHWQVRVTGDPLPKVTWLRDGQPIPNCDEVQLTDEGHGVHSMVIKKVESVDGGQFTCLAENAAGEARSTADLVVRRQNEEPGTFFHITKVTQEKQVKGEEVSRNQTFSIENPRATPTK